VSIQNSERLSDPGSQGDRALKEVEQQQSIHLKKHASKFASELGLHTMDEGVEAIPDHVLEWIRLCQGKVLQSVTAIAVAIIIIVVIIVIVIIVVIISVVISVVIICCVIRLKATRAQPPGGHRKQERRIESIPAVTAELESGFVVSRYT
jgi:hypothetical protein